MCEREQDLLYHKRVHKCGRQKREKERNLNDNFKREKSEKFYPISNMEKNELSCPAFYRNSID